MSSKYLNYLDWEEVYNMILKKEHLKTEGKEKIKLIKNRIHNKRTNYNWDHLN